MLEVDPLVLNLNPLVQDLGKSAEKFMRADTPRLACKRNMPVLNLCYIDGDGRSKTPNFATQFTTYPEGVPTIGERVGGSSPLDLADAVSSDPCAVS